MGSLLLSDVSKVYPGQVDAVKHFSLDVANGEMVVLVGPSGCGKSTTLRMVAGLEDVTSGTISIGGAVVTDLSPKDRNVAMVFQSHALYPHMNVYDNMAFGLKVRKLPKKQIDEQVRKAAEMLGVESLLTRKPKTLSGGQCQRVAMGRAIVRNPSVFLMDEPLSNLDAKLRVQMRSVIVQIHEELNSTFMYVTHDQAEAMSLATKIVVMDNGEVQQVGSPREVYDRPANVFVAGFIGSPQMNLVDVEVCQIDKCLSINAPGLNIRCPDGWAEALGRVSSKGKKFVLGIRPEDIAVSSHERDSISVIISDFEYLGSETLAYCGIGKTQLVVRVSSQFHLRRGDSIGIKINESSIHLFDGKTGGRII